MSSMIVLEGTDAAGKQTQSERLRMRLERMGREVVCFSFPRYKTPLGEAIRKHLTKQIAVMESYSRDSSDHNIDGEECFRTAPEDAMIFQAMMVTDKYDAAPDIEAAINCGAIVICDRWWHSAFCYGAADGLAKEWLLRAHQRLPQADLNFWIDIPIEEALRRRPKARDRYEEDRGKQAAVRENYLALWSGSDDPLGSRRSGRYIVIDGQGTKEQVHEDIWQNVINQSKRSV